MRALVLVAVMVMVTLMAMTWTQAEAATRLRGLEQGDGDARPVVGILTQPWQQAMATEGYTEAHDANVHEHEDNAKQSYIAASYVKFVESAGARVVPIMYTASDEEIVRVFAGLSGILFAGGDADIRPGARYYETAKKLYDLAEASNLKGETFPIFGTCLGWELLAVLASGGNYSVLHTDYDDPGVAARVQWTSAAPASTLLSKTTRPLQRAFEARPLAFFSHHMGVRPETARRNPHLSRAFRVLATAADRRGTPFVAAAEAHGRPYLAVQFHPEKSPFEWSTSAKLIPHSSEAVEMSSALALAFGDAMRASTRRAAFAGGEKEAFSRLVLASGKLLNMGDSYFSAVYLFPPPQEDHATRVIPSSVAAAS